MRLEGVTIACVDCVDRWRAAKAVEHCLRQVKPDEAVLITDRPVPFPGRLELIPPIRSVRDYSRFMLRDLARYISTDFVLVVQADGVVVNAGMWSDDFIAFDYVGAPWPGEWFGEEQCVGNGGFSLRSRRLCNILARDPRVIDYHPEDAVICRRYRSWLESDYGIRFPPRSIAERFSFEYGERVGPTFGVHGREAFFVDRT